MSTARPDILLLTADDMGGDTPGCFGGPGDVTPHLEALAASGMSFGRAHVAAAVCQPSRSAIMTGLWPHRNGAEGFEPIDQGITVLTHVLKDAGYRVGILGKVGHLQPVEAFGWDLALDMRQLGMGRDPAAYGDAAARFIADAKAEGRPWFLMANAHDPHRPFSGSDEERSSFSEQDRSSYPSPSKIFGSADDVRVPGFLPPLPEVAREYCEYLSSSRRCDDVVGAVLTALQEGGDPERTVAIFLSDNGIAVPFAKANCYLQSSRTPFIVRWPGVTDPGTREDESFVSMLDLFPTLCEAAGAPVPTGLDGRTLLPLLRGTSAGRDEVFTVFHETSAKRRYEMRCRQDDRTGYIWNCWADGDREYAAENMHGRSWAAMVEASAQDAGLARRTDFYLHRAPEELYDLVHDPHSMTDLVGDPVWQPALDEARTGLLAWMVETSDPLQEAYRAFLQATSTVAGRERARPHRRG